MSIQEGVSERVSGYFHKQTVRTAEDQLHEQALAAFPNNDYHEPVQHYIGRDFDEPGPMTEESKRLRDVSFNEVNWELTQYNNTGKSRKSSEKLK